jgi:LCP family protein required for cell wall assembly
MSFSKKKLWVWWWFDWKKRLQPSRLAFWSAILACLVLIFLIVKQVAGFTGHTIERFTWSAIKLVTQQVWSPMQMDEFWHVNVLIVWYAWKNYRGGFLTDTLMLASFNPEAWTVSFISIPRDLYVAFWRGATSRINSLYRSMYLDGKEDHELGISSLLDKVSEITWVPTHYYAMVDFDNFVSFVDEMWWVTVDVKEPLYDDQFPWQNDSYTVFQVSAWVQQFDWATALKFARSRKSTSDFSRSFRQQQIISAIVEQLKNSVSVTNLWAMKQLYTKWMSLFRTNIGVENMIRLSQFTEKQPQFFSFVFESDCNTSSYKLTKPWCVLQYGNRAAFGGQSVVIPDWAKPSNLSYYVKTKDVAHRLVYRQDVLQEQTPIVIKNWIDKAVAKAWWYKTTWIAEEIAVELVLRWFQVQDVNNAETPLEKTTLYVSNKTKFAKTVEALAAFVPYVEVIESVEFGEWATVVLWNDWLKRM